MHSSEMRAGGGGVDVFVFAATSDSARGRIQFDWHSASIAGEFYQTATHRLRGPVTTRILIMVLSEGYAACRA